ncbi:hypothetical protein HO133_007451 [Letharia lupina]|uniref:Uncharacterized protein n=1 Tax=Letharia lupina TaxID=560253 RepID=A0A8H6KYU6_9LECA|nr:uncharacterized protein HO133_007451 [Letharia lupina]KAF6229335.1 hypothetical protein HO133_007451 [Letharia lupina]
MSYELTKPDKRTTPQLGSPFLAESVAGPRDDSSTSYQTLIWGNRPKIQIIAGQHRKLALKIHEPTNFTWLANVYDLDAMPPTTLIELGGNATTVAHAASMGEVFRDIAAIAPHIASSETVIVRPYLTPQCAPTLEEYLGACRHGDKAKLQKTFMNALTVCSQQKSIDKLIIVLASPLRGELSRFVNSGAGIKLFSQDGMRDMFRKPGKYRESVLNAHGSRDKRVGISRMASVNGHAHHDLGSRLPQDLRQSRTGSESEVSVVE